MWKHYAEGGLRSPSWRAKTLSAICFCALGGDHNGKQKMRACARRPVKPYNVLSSKKRLNTMRRETVAEAFRAYDVIWKNAACAVHTYL